MVTYAFWRKVKHYNIICTWKKSCWAHVLIQTLPHFTFFLCKESSTSNNVICILQEYSDVFTWMVRVPSSLTNICPCVVPANINSWLPSLVQKTEGGGFPVAWHSNLAMPFMPTLWSLGLTRKLGCAAEEEKDWDSKIRLLHDHLEILWGMDLDF